MSAMPAMLTNFEISALLVFVNVVFIGMFALAWRAMTIAHDLSKQVIGRLPESPTPVPVIPPAKATPVPAPSSAPSTQAAVVDEGLVNYIKKTEGFSAKAYWDYKQWTNGYGTRAASANEVVDEATATQRLAAEIGSAYNLVNKFKSGLPKGAAQALTDLTYNAGSGWEQGSLGAAVKAEKWDTVKADILQYNHAGGQVLAGLTKRREDEVSWFDNPL